MRGIYIRWQDHSQLSDASETQVWHPMSDLENIGVCEMETLGWLLKETDDVLVVSGHKDAGDEPSGFTGELTIDKRTITYRAWVTLPKRRKK